MKLQNKLNKRRLKYGGVATALTVLVIAAIVMVNIVATMLFDRFPITLDLTSGGIYTVSDETVEYIKGVKTPVQITVLSTEEDYRAISDYTAQCVELLKNYTRHNSDISVQYINMMTNPDFVADYTQRLEEGDIIVEPAGGDHSRVKIVSLADLITVPDEYASMLSQSKTYGAKRVHQYFVAGAKSRQVKISSNTEQALTSAIMAVTDENPIIVAVLSYPGASESDISGLTDMLDKSGYVLQYIDIQAEEISDDVDLAIIPAPKLDYSNAEIQKLEDWLSGGGMLEKDLIYVASVDQPETPNLDGLLYKYGVTVERKIIHETSTRRYSNVETYTYQDIITQNYLRDVTNMQLPLFVPDARAISLRFDNVDSTYSCEAVVASSDTAVLKPMNASASWTVENAAERGSFNTVAVAKQKKINQDTHISTYTHVIVFGSDLMLQNRLTSVSSFNNGSFIISMLNEITGKSAGVTVKSTDVNTGSFDITEAQTRTLTLVFVLIIPVAVLAAGTFVWIRRRHR